MKELFNLLEEILKKDKANKYELLGFLMEEVGEVAVALNVESGAKSRKLDEPVESECADVILNAMALMIKKNIDYNKFKQLIEKKMKKWESKL